MVVSEEGGLEVRIYYLECLAQATYIISHNGTAFIVDPRRDVEVYIKVRLRATNTSVKLNEVTRQTTQLHPGQLLFSEKGKRAALGGIRTHDTLLSRQVLYQLSYQGNSACLRV